jgi:adenosine deaminase
MTQIHSIPKVILHTHLEGSLPISTLELLSSRNKVLLSFNPTLKNIYKNIETNNWSTFLKIYYEICSCLITHEDFREALFQYGKKLHSENVVYAEILFSPWNHLSRGIPLEVLSKGFISAIEELENEFGIVVKLICDLVRHQNEKVDEILNWVKELPRNYFVGIGISGGANAVQRKSYMQYCEIAKKYDLKISAHAGEMEGPDSVIEAIKYLFADRISHGIRSIENEKLINELIIKQIHFEICPTSNKIIGLCHENFNLIKNIISKGINFSVNPDDELIFDTDISKEIEILISENIIDINQVFNLQKNALINSFADKNTINKLMKSHFYDCQ